MTTGLSASPRSVRTLGRRTANVLLTVGALLGIVCIVLTSVALIFGVRPVIFRSGSMAPGIDTGAIAISHRVAADDLHVGDVVTVHTAGGSLLSHRIVGITQHGDGGASLRLRGDANGADDAASYNVSSAYRVWFSVPRLGYAVSWLTGPMGILGFGAYAGALLVIVVRHLRRGPARHAASRHSAARQAAAVPAVLLLIAAGSGGALTRLTQSTAASWTDASTVSGTSLTTLTVPPPSTFTCGLLGVLSVTFNWTAVPGATNYTVHSGAGGSVIQTVTGTTATITSLISGGTAWVEANRNFGSTTWTSAPSVSRSYTVAVVSLCA